MSDKEKIPAAKLTLSSGRVVIVRIPKMLDIEQATRAAGAEAAGNQAVMGLVMQRELVKRCLLRVDGKDLSLNEKEALEFSPGEYIQISTYIQEASGLDNQEKPKVEIVTV